MNYTEFTKHHILAILCCLMISVSACVGDKPSQNKNIDIDVSPTEMSVEMDTFLKQYYKPSDPGATIIVTKDGHTIFRKAYGMADLERGIALKPDMVMRLASVSKQFTAAAIMLLSDEGKLSVSDDITKYLPHFPTHGKKITIENLLTHTSGIKDLTSVPSFAEDRDQTVAELLATFENEPLEFIPGEKADYSNSGYTLLGAIIEAVSGMTYADFMAIRIFEPLNMTHTAYEGHERGPFKRVEGYKIVDGSIKKAKHISMTVPYSAGALVSNVDDMALWDAAITQGKLLKPETWKRVFAPFKLKNGDLSPWGYGWEIVKVNGLNATAHEGGIAGFSTYVVRIPESRVYVAVLCNTSTPVAWSIYLANRLAAIASGKPYPKIRTITLDVHALEKFMGSYRSSNNENNVIKVFMEGAEPYVQHGKELRTLLQPTSELEFHEFGTDLNLKFIKNAQGDIVGSTLINDDGVEFVQFSRFETN